MEPMEWIKNCLSFIKRHWSLFSTYWRYTNKIIIIIIIIIII